MFMTGCVVLVMSSSHDKDTDRLWCIGLCQGVITERMTLNDSCHKYVMSWLWRCHVSLKHTPSSKVLPKCSEYYNILCTIVRVV